MSAEIIRRAASRIRHDVDFGQAHGDDAFLLAVADWIDSHARDLASADGHLPSCDSPGDVQQALTVARAYLGESS